MQVLDYIGISILVICILVTIYVAIDFGMWWREHRKRFF